MKTIQKELNSNLKIDFLLCRLMSNLSQNLKLQAVKGRLLLQDPERKELQIGINK